MQKFETREPFRIEGKAGTARLGSVRDQGLIARAEKGSNQSFQGFALHVAPDHGRDPARLVPEPVGRFIAPATNEGVEMGFDLTARQGARYVSTAPTGGGHVVEIGPRGRGEEEIADERKVGGLRGRPSAGPDRHARQFDVALAIGNDEDRAVGRRLVLDRGSVGDQRAGDIGADKGP